MPSRGARAAHRDRERGDLPRAARRARRDRPPAHRQVPGLLPRLARLGRDERDLAARERRPAAIRSRRGSSPRSPRRRSSAASTTPTRSSARSPSTTSPRSSSSRSRTTSARVLPQPGFLERLRELATKHGTVLIFDEVITGFRHALGGYQSICRRHARPDDDGQGDGQRLAGLGARREGRADGALQHDARPARVLRRHLQRPPADRGGRARDDRQAPARAGARARLPARRADAAGAARAVRAARRAGARQRLRLGLRHLLPRGRRRRATTTCSRTTSTCSSVTAAS